MVSEIVYPCMTKSTRRSTAVQSFITAKQPIGLAQIPARSIPWQIRPAKIIEPIRLVHIVGTGTPRFNAVRKGAASPIRPNKADWTLFKIQLSDYQYQSHISRARQMSRGQSPEKIRLLRRLRRSRNLIPEYTSAHQLLKPFAERNSQMRSSQV